MMPLNYHKVWESMNDLEMVTSKVCSAREILDSAIDALESGNREKTETLMYAADEFLQYYLAEFDEKFKVAWKETVTKLKNAEDDGMPPWGHSDLEYGLANPLLTQNRDSNFPGENTICDKDNPSEECKDAWNDFWHQNNQYPDEELNGMCEEAESYYNSATQTKTSDKVTKWQLPVEEDSSGEYFVTFPDDLLEATGWKEGELLEWFDNGDGSYVLKKVTATENT